MGVRIDNIKQEETGTNMNKLRVALSTLVLTLVLAFGGNAAFAAPAHAYTSWYSETIACDYVYTYYHVDYNWWEETFQGKRDYKIYIGVKYRYNYWCHNRW